MVDGFRPNLRPGYGLLYLKKNEWNEFEWTGNGPGIDLDLSLAIPGIMTKHLAQLISYFLNPKSNLVK